jgi:hypothetical protein
MKVRKAWVGLALMVAMIGGSAMPATAAPDEAGIGPGELCVKFRPYDAGTVYSYVWFAPYKNTYCRVQYEPNLCYEYWVRWFGGWNGPFDIVRIWCP